MTGNLISEGGTAVQPPSDQLPQKIVKYIASKELPTSAHVYLTKKDDGSLTLHTADTWLWEWELGSYGSSLQNIYRLAREKLNAKKLTFHVPTLEMALNLHDALENEVRFKRLALMQDETMPTPPPHPDQAAIDLLAELEAEIDALDD